MEKHFPTAVLIMDPAPMVAESIAACLESRGYYPVVALSRDAAERVVRAHAVDVLIAHGHIAGDRTPFQFATEAGAACSRLAIVAVTSDANADHPFVPGRASVLAKPFGLDALLAAIVHAQKLAAIHAAAMPRVSRPM
jgi:DNA-binding response OmpR family regulator